MDFGPKARNRATLPGPQKRVFLGCSFRSVFGWFWPLFPRFRPSGPKPVSPPPGPGRCFRGPKGPLLGSVSGPLAPSSLFWLSQGLGFCLFSLFLALFWPLLGSVWGLWPPPPFLALTGPWFGLFSGFSALSAGFGLFWALRAPPSSFGLYSKVLLGPLAPFRPFWRPGSPAAKSGRPVASLGRPGPQMYHFRALWGPKGPQRGPKGPEGPQTPVTGQWSLAVAGFAGHRQGPLAGYRVWGP